MHGASTALASAAPGNGLATETTARALDRALQRLLDLQQPDGHWVGELQGDTILESEYVLLLAFLGREREDRCRKLANYILSQQRADGDLEQLPRWAARTQRLGQGVLRA